MDSRAASVISPVASRPAAHQPGTTRCERAVFTSARSALGEGYRIIAASSGLSAAQKQELTRRCPSHGGLCDTSAAASGWASIALESGGRVLVLASTAGAEHSARGGARIYSRVILIPDADFEQLGCDPLRVRHAVRGWESEPALAAPCDEIPPLELTLRAMPRPPRGGLPGPRLSPTDALRFGSILRAVLERRVVIVNDAPSPELALRHLIAALPVHWRRSLTFSVGLTHAPSRPVRVAFVRAPAAAMQRWAAGADAVLVDWSSTGLADASTFDPWLELVMPLWSAGRLSDLDRLSACLRRQESAGELVRVASLCRHISDARRRPVAAVLAGA